MNMKEMTVFVAGLLLVSGTMAQDVDMSNFGADQLYWFEVGTGPWKGIFFFNGAARLMRNGGDVFEQADVPKGSFSFEEVYNRLMPHVIKESVYGNMSVQFIAGRSHKMHMLCSLSDTEECKATVRKLMFELRDKSYAPMGKQALEELFRKYPLVKGDKPVPYTYKKMKPRPSNAARDAINDKRYEEQYRRIVGRDIRQALAEEAERGEASVSPEEEERIIEKEVARWKASNVSSGIPKTETPAPSRRPWLYSGILAVLCAGVAFWFMRKKR